MADHVIHGEGKPRFTIDTPRIWSGTNSASSATSITLNGSPVLDDLNNVFGLINALVRSGTTDSPAEDTVGKITAYNDTTDILTIDEWSNGTPGVSKPVIIQNKRIDLPFCQRLIETFTPDFIVKKMITGEIRRNKRGFYYSARLDYSRYFHKDNMALLKDLFNINNSNFVFYPRVDNLSVSYPIDIDPESEVSFYQLQAHQGHGGVIINIIGLSRKDWIPFDPTIPDLGKVVMDGEGLYVTDDYGGIIQED